ncbi:hypothetical protein JCM10450v2_000309 [Rhodotorula kratochvilovae]
MATSVSPAPAQGLPTPQPPIGAAPSFPHHRESPVGREDSHRSPPPHLAAGSPWSSNGYQQRTEPSHGEAQSRRFAPRDSGFGAGDEGRSHDRDDAHASPHGSAARPFSPHSSSGISPVRSNPSSAGATSPPTVHARPPSALSSGSSSHAHTFPSPRTHHPLPYASSSLSSAAAFDYDDLLGPHPRAALSGASGSPPSSNEDDKLRRGDARMQGLGFSASPRGESGGTFGELYGPEEEEHEHEDEDDDERWKHLRSMRLDSTLPTPPMSSPPSQPSSLGNHVSRTSSSTAVSGAVGSPLSPHVAPFAPSAAALSAATTQPPQGNPWTTRREREASWNSVASSTYASQAQQRAFPTLTSPSTFTSSTASLTQQTPLYSSSTYASHGFAQQQQHDAPAAHIMTEAASRGLGNEGYLPSRAPLAVRAPYLERAEAVGSARPGSASGAESVVSSAQDPAAEVSTIFVVGFPDDMLEREFQNMFVFAEGFEAATLKLPLPKDGSVAGSEAGDARPDEAAQQVPLLLEGFAPLPSLPPHLNPALPAREQLLVAREAASGASTPLSSSAGASGGAGAGAGRRQIIGFARFRTRQQALDARDALSGRKVDAERGCVLKAEMAKKNLHTRRPAPPHVVIATTTAPSSTASAQSSALQSARPGTPVAPQVPSATTVEAAAPVAAAATSAATTMGGSGPSIPLSALDAQTLQKLAQTSNLNPAVLAEIARQSAAGKVAAAPAPVAAPAPDPAAAAYEAFHRREYFELDTPAALLQGYPQGPSSAASASPPLQPSLLPGLGGQRSMLQQLDEGVVAAAAAAAGSLPYASPDLRGPHTREPSFASVTGPTGPPNPYSTYASPGPGAAPLSPSLSGVGVGIGIGAQVPSAQARQAAMHSLGSPSGGFASAAMSGIPRTQNPADMNAPKNTLYVGGLPAVLPSLTGPFSASHLEDSLRNAFSRCPGYKRLQFRYKSNGPIVFVEFVDTAHATRAMQELYGHTLGGLVKGGIRLSYSKNPLGVRSNGQPALSGPPLHPHAAHESPHGGYTTSPYVGSPVGGPSALPFEPVGVDPYRRPPDPIYGETAYPSLARSPPLAPAQPAGHSPFGPPSAFGGGGNGSGPSSSTATPSHYGGAFSPFSVEL